MFESFGFGTMVFIMGIAIPTTFGLMALVFPDAKPENLRNHVRGLGLCLVIIMPWNLYVLSKVRSEIRSETERVEKRANEYTRAHVELQLLVEQAKNSLK